LIFAKRHYDEKTLSVNEYAQMRCKCNQVSVIENFYLANYMLYESPDNM